MREGVAQASEHQNALQEVEALVSHRDDVASDQSNHDAPHLEHELQLVFPSTYSPSNLDAMDGASASRIEHQPTLLVENSLQPITGGSVMHASERTMTVTSGISNHPVQTTTHVQMPLPLCKDPLQNELERIRKETDQAINIHEDTVSFLFTQVSSMLESCFMC